MSQKQIKNVLDDSSAELANLNNMIGSIIGNGRRPTCRGRYEFTTQKYYASMLYEIYELHIYVHWAISAHANTELLRAGAKRIYRQIGLLRVVVQSC